MNFQLQTGKRVVRQGLLVLLFGALAGVASPANAAPRRTTPPSKAPAKAVVPDNPKFADFKAALEKMVKEQSSNYGEALDILLSATDDDDSVIPVWMQAAAAQGNAAAERWLLNNRLSNIQPEELNSPEIKEAYQGMLRLADKGYVPAILDVSEALRKGIGVTKDESAAQRKLMEACKGGSFLARVQWLVSTNRLNSSSDQDKPEVASEVKRGNHFVIYRLANLTADPVKRNELLMSAGRAGSAEAYFALSALISASKPKESLVLLNEAVRLYNPDALFTLGSVLMSDETSTPFSKEAGITKDPKRGLHLLKLGAALGSFQAILVLGRSYYDGTDAVEQNYEKAYSYLNSPRVGGYAAIATGRAICLLLGKGVKQDAPAAIKLLERANKVGYANAALSLAYAYYKGLGVEPDARRAADLLSEAATSSPSAYVYLAYITAKGGPGLSADPAQARRFIRLASMDMGDKASQLYETLVTSGDWEPHP